MQRALERRVAALEAKTLLTSDSVEFIIVHIVEPDRRVQPSDVATFGGQDLRRAAGESEAAFEERAKLAARVGLRHDQPAHIIFSAKGPSNAI